MSKNKKSKVIPFPKKDIASMSLFNMAKVIDELRAENNKLKKENLELKKQLDKSASNNSKHNP